MHFEITKYKIFLGKGLLPYNTQNLYTYIHLDQKKTLLPCNPQIIGP